MTQSVSEVAKLCHQAPFCPAPIRVAPSSWMSHIPFAFWLVNILRPRVLVELGSYYGASFCAFCQQIERLGLPCEAYAVDLWQGDAHMGAYSEEVHAELAAHVARHYPGFACLLRSSFDDALPQFEDGSIDLLHLDGCHASEAILHDFNAWLPKMSSRGVVLIHDVCARLPGYGGVSAWASISSRFPSFAFTHGYGLGVVLTGTDAPAPLQELAGMDTTALDMLKSLFQEQGKIYETLFSMEEQRRSDILAAKNRENDMAREFVALKEILVSERADRARENAVWNKEREQLKEALLAAELKAQAYAGSLSWKITAPLRKAASWCRS